MEFYKFLTVLTVCLGAVQARGAGRAFPIDSENYVIDAFQSINRNIEWDETNMLVDLSGQYANCDNLGSPQFLNVDRDNSVGGSLAVYLDDTAGSASDVDAVNSYIRSVIDRWTSSSFSDIYQQISAADRFGCSVRPGCRGRAAVACIFSPSNIGGEIEQPPNIDEGKQNALAFTEDQYDVAEAITGENWDRNHLLENLSGYETSCAMIYERSWPFAYAITEAAKRGMVIEGLYGSAKNRGETEPAMVEILKNMKTVYGTKSVGCSIIPDCRVGEGAGAELFVVVGCIFQV